MAARRRSVYNQVRPVLKFLPSGLVFALPSPRRGGALVMLNHVVRPRRSRGLTPRKGGRSKPSQSGSRSEPSHEHALGSASPDPILFILFDIEVLDPRFLGSIVIGDSLCDFCSSPTTGNVLTIATKTRLWRSSTHIDLTRRSRATVEGAQAVRAASKFDLDSDLGRSLRNQQRAATACEKLPTYQTQRRESRQPNLEIRRTL